MIFYLFYIISIILIVIPILKIVSYNLMNENTLFILLTNYILNIAVVIFLCYFENYIFSLLFGIILFIFAFLLIKNFQKIFGSYELTSVPYFLVVFYTLMYILVIFFQNI